MATSIEKGSEMFPSRIKLNLSPATLIKIERALPAGECFLCINLSSLIRGMLKETPTIDYVDDGVVEEFMNRHPELVEHTTVIDNPCYWDFSSDFTELGIPQIDTSEFTNELFRHLDKKFEIHSDGGVYTMTVRYGFTNSRRSYDDREFILKGHGRGEIFDRFDLKCRVYALEQLTENLVCYVTPYNDN